MYLKSEKKEGEEWWEVKKIKMMNGRVSVGAVAS